MKNRILRSLLSSTLSIMPIIVIVYVLSVSNLAPIGDTFTITGLGTENYVLLAIGAAVMIIGLALFQIGAEKGLSKVGEHMGASLSKQRSLFIVIIFAFTLGALITCAEPSIMIVAHQVSINKWILIFSIAGGVGIFVVIGILRIVFQKSLNLWYLFYYLLVFLLICLLQVDPNNHAFLPFIFDAGGVTTGSATVPFILALGAGVATTQGGKNSRDSSFGLVGLASVGPILTMTLLILLNPTGFSAYEVPSVEAASIWERFLVAILPSNNFTSMGSIIEVLMALLPIIIVFFIYDLIYIKLPGRKVLQLLVGFFISFLGLVLFLTAVSAVMNPIGLQVGKALGIQSDWIVILIAFIIGMVTILCEPAVHVLTTQIEDISDGQLKKTIVLAALSIGVGVAIGLSMIRTIFKFSILWIIVPGYLLSFVLMFFVPDIYTAIAFDSGGTASGPMAVSFVLPLIIGVYSTRTGLTKDLSFYEHCFGVIALIAMTPILAIQVLGLASKFKTNMAFRVMRQQMADSRNDEIIHFN